MAEQFQPGPDDVKCESPDCKKYFKKISGRKDKRFCNDGCRNAYNNAKRKKKSGVMETINEILESNHAILSALIGSKKFTYVAARVLRDKGFNLKYFTHQYESKDKTVYLVCYDLAYRQKANTAFEIIKESAKGEFAK